MAVVNFCVIPYRGISCCLRIQKHVITYTYPLVNPLTQMIFLKLLASSNTFSEDIYIQIL